MKAIGSSVFRFMRKSNVFKFTSYKQNNHFNALIKRPCANFCNKNITPNDVAQQNLQIRHEQVTIGEEVVDSFETKGAISILDHLEGVKSEDSELYALKFTCGQCNTQAIRTFTKNAYHKGVVLVRCEGCDNVHLVADNLGWFDDQPQNLQNIGEGKVQKVHDPVAVVKFLQTAFGKSGKSSPQQGIKDQ